MFQEMMVANGGGGGGVTGANGFFTSPRSDRVHLYLCDENGVADVTSVDNDWFTVTGTNSSLATLNVTYKKAGTITKIGSTSTVSDTTVTANQTEQINVSGSLHQLTLGLFYKTV